MKDEQREFWVIAVVLVIAFIVLMSFVGCRHVRRKHVEEYTIKTDCDKIIGCAYSRIGNDGYCYCIYYKLVGTAAPVPDGGWKK